MLYDWYFSQWNQQSLPGAGISPLTQRPGILPDAPTFSGCGTGCNWAGDGYQTCHQWHHYWLCACCWLLLNVICSSDATKWTTMLLSTSESLKMFQMSLHFLTSVKRAKSSLLPISSLPLPSHVTDQVTWETSCDYWNPIQMVWRGSLCKEKKKKKQSKIFSKIVSNIQFISVSSECYFQKKAESAKLLRVLALLTPMILSGVSWYLLSC